MELLTRQVSIIIQVSILVFFQVIHWEHTLRIPLDMLSREAGDLIERLCCGAENRLGYRGADEIKAHPFFASIQFDGLRKQPSLYKPIIKHTLDTSNFDPVDDDDDDSEVDSELRNIDHLVNGKFPEHAFFEFTFKRFFDDAGHPYPAVKGAQMNINTKDDKDSETSSETNAPVYV